jgi:O-antigen/teichoic acid export membrane protein
MLPVLALGVWPSALALSIEPALTAIGQPRYATFGNFWKALFTGAGIPLAFAGFGMAGAVVVVALNDLPYYGLIAYGLRRERLTGFAQDAKATLLLLAALAAALLVRYSLGFGLPFQRHA